MKPTPMRPQRAFDDPACVAPPATSAKKTKRSGLGVFNSPPAKRTCIAGQHDAGKKPPATSAKKTKRSGLGVFNSPPAKRTCIAVQRDAAAKKPPTMGAPKPPPSDTYLNQPKIVAAERHDERMLEALESPTSLEHEEVDHQCKYYRIPEDFVASTDYQPGAMCVYLDALEVGMRLPLHRFQLDLFLQFGIAPGQVMPRGWYILLGFLLVCHQIDVHPSTAIFLNCFRLRRYGSHCSFQAITKWKLPDHRHGRHRGNSKNWKKRFFFLKSKTPWGYPVEWGEIPPTSHPPVLTATEQQSLEMLINHGCKMKVELDLYDSANMLMATTPTLTFQDTCTSEMERIKTLENLLESANEELKNRNRMLEDMQLRLRQAEQQILEGEELRKKLHNTILELKGNIRVFCRVRPSFSNEPGAVSYPKSGDNMGCGIDLMHNAQAYSFTFDKVFDHSASQEDVFIEISQLVQSALDGYKVCIFAYGQTGSGKTHTMMGNPEIHEQKGLIPRSLEQIFQTCQSLSSQGWKYEIQASMLEIYNETIRDLLLVTNRTGNQDGGTSKYAIQHDANGNTHVSDLTAVVVRSIKEVSPLLQLAAQSRSVGRTQMNEESSRSHCVFTLRIIGVNEGMDQHVQGVLNLIDLAGNERVNKSGATGDRLREAQAINKSLSCLSDVIVAIANKEEHVPFRNSKLTYLLQPCLGGQSKTLMFVNLSPEVSSTGESICSLRFAARVKSCEIGVPRRQTRMGGKYGTHQESIGRGEGAGNVAVGNTRRKLQV